MLIHRCILIQCQMKVIGNNSRSKIRTSFSSATMISSKPSLLEVSNKCKKEATIKSKKGKMSNKWSATKATLTSRDKNPTWRIHSRLQEDPYRCHGKECAHKHQVAISNTISFRIRDALYLGGCYLRELRIRLLSAARVLTGTLWNTIKRLKKSLLKSRGP